MASCLLEKENAGLIWRLAITTAIFTEVELLWWLKKIKIHRIVDIKLERIPLQGYLKNPRTGHAPSEPTYHSAPTRSICDDGTQPVLDTGYIVTIRGYLTAKDETFESILERCAFGWLLEYFDTSDHLSDTNVFYFTMKPSARAPTVHHRECVKHPLRPCRHLRQGHGEWADSVLNRMRKAVQDKKKMQGKILSDFGSMKRSYTGPELYPTMAELALRHGFVSGHWSCYFSWEPHETQRMRKLWSELLVGFLVGPLDHQHQLHLKSSKDGYSIAIHNDTFLDLPKIYACELRIRRAGVTEDLKYKPDIYSVCNIIHGNRAAVRPTILKSRYDGRNERSVITTDYTDGYIPEIDFEGFVYYNYV